MAPARSSPSFDTRYLHGHLAQGSARIWARTMAELGVYTRNELRDEDGRDPLPGLDEPLTPLNMGGGQQKPDCRAPEETMMTQLERRDIVTVRPAAQTALPSAFEVKRRRR
jgi:hypothetical protein